MILLEQGDAGDIAAIMPVMTTAFDPGFRENWTAPQCAAAMAMPGSAMFIAKLEGQAVGFALVRSVLEEAELLLLATAPEHQKQGIGVAILDFAIAYLRHKQVKSLFLEVRINNAARGFYDRMGFTENGRRKDYYRSISGEYADAVTLVKIID